MAVIPAFYACRSRRGEVDLRTKFRQTDARYPFLGESAQQPAGRWHGSGDGAAHYFADTPDGAWAEFLRHEEITDPADVATIRRQMWAVEIGDEPAEPVRLAEGVMTGGLDTHPPCQTESRRLRARGRRRLVTVTSSSSSAHHKR